MLRIDEAALRSLILLVLSLIHLTTRALRGARVAVHPRDKRAHGRSWRPDALLLLSSCPPVLLSPALEVAQTLDFVFFVFFVFFVWEPAGWMVFFGEALLCTRTTHASKQPRAMH